MFEWLGHFVAKSEYKVDSIVVLGAFSMLAMCVFQAYAEWLDKNTFSAAAFAAGAASIIVAVGGGKTARDHWTPPEGAPADDNVQH